MDISVELSICNNNSSDIIIIVLITWEYSVLRLLCCTYMKNLKIYHEILKLITLTGNITKLVFYVQSTKTEKSILLV